MNCPLKKCHTVHKLRRIIVWALMLALLCGLPVSDGALASGNGTVKVKLTRLGTVSSLKMSVSCDYVLSGDVKMNIPSGSSVNVSASGGRLTVEQNGVTLYCGSSAALLRCGGGTSGIRFSSLSNVFCGDLYLYASGSTITPVLHLYIEDYLYGVVAYEMSNSFPLEALKAQAVAARNYVLKKMSSRASSSYHVTDTSSDQVFKGYNSSYSRVIQAVNETAGQALYSGSSLASCYYSASNGGQTEATKNTWGGSLSYSTVKDDPYDLQNASAKKTTATIRRDAGSLNASLKAALLEGAQGVLNSAGADLSTAQITSINAITPCNPKYASPSRLYRTLRFSISLKAKNARTGLMVYTDATVDIPTYGGLENWYGLSINSSTNETISVEQGVDAFQVVFRRWGHGIGMSQRGAQTMASAYGKDHDFILDFYYPGTTLKTLGLSRPGSHASIRVDGEVLARVRTNAAAQLYVSADASAAVRAALSAGSALDVYDMNENWAAVGILGLTGFVPVEYLDGLPEPTATPTMEPSPTPEPTATPTLESSPTPEPTATPTMEPSPTPAPTAEPTPEPTATPAPTATAQPEVSPSATASAQPTATLPVILPTPGPTATAEPTASPVATVQPMQTPQASATTIPTATLPAFTPTPAPSLQPGVTPTVRPTATVVFLPTSTPRPTAEPTAEPTMEPTAEPTSVPTAVPTAVPTSRPTEEPTWLPEFEPLPTVMDRPMPTPAPAPEGAEGMLVATGTLYAYVKVSSGSSLTLRKTASTASAPLAYLKNGAQVQLIAFDDEWAYVRTASGASGFAARRYLYLPGSDDSQPVVEDTPKVEPSENESESGGFSKFREVKTNITFCNVAARTKAAVKVYGSYSTSSAVLGSLPASTRVTVTAFNSSWAYVKIGSKRGFIQLKYLKAE